MGGDDPVGGDEPAVQRWQVVIPVKPARRGKSRLASGASREGLARAIALDTIAAAASCPVVAQVFVVTDDAGLPLAAADIPGLRFVAEEPRFSATFRRSGPTPSPRCSKPPPLIRGPWSPMPKAPARRW